VIETRLERESISSPRLLFSRGCRGGIVRSMQERLRARGCYAGVIDGIYGAGTARGVSEFQRQSRRPITGDVDDITWKALMNINVPTLFERALQLTAALENHGFGVIRGNWDGAWLTWGVIGFTLKSGEIPRILLQAEAADPNLLGSAFGIESRILARILRASPAEQEQWANSVSDGVTVREPWRTGFERLGNHPLVQRLQLDRARSAYFPPAVRTAAAFRLETERGLSLAFDIHVQNGGINPAARSLILSRQASVQPGDEQSRRVIIANAVADGAKREFRDDVRARKLAIATGQGAVHGEMIITAHWGLAEYPVRSGTPRELVSRGAVAMATVRRPP